MNNRKIYSAIACTVLSAGILVAQEKKKSDLGTEVVDVVRSYDATISDAFKVRETPNMNEDANTKKKQVVYTINSFPVASTFVPEKGKAAEVDREARLAALNNYVLFGIGNYMNLNAEAFISKKLDADSYIAGRIDHFSSQGGIKNVLLDDKFSKSKASVIYGGQKKNFGWKAEVGGFTQMSNWYGLPTKNITEEESKIVASQIDPKQKYNNVFVDGDLEFRNIPLSEVKLSYNHFSDDYSTSENSFRIKPQFETQISDLQARLGLVLDYVGTTYKEPFGNNSNYYKNFNVGLEPSVVFADENYSVQLGLGIYNNNGTYDDTTNNSFHIYPQVRASYKLVENIVNAYAGIEGGLKQNTYREFVEANPFVAPNVGITPTDERFNVYFGLKGKLDHMISYNIRASYKDERDRALFVSNPFGLEGQRKAYMFGNSFNVEYGDMKTLNLFGELTFDFDKDVAMRLYGEYNNYDAAVGQAWNLPTSKIGADFKFDFTDKWFAGADLYFVGSRKDRFTREVIDVVSKEKSYVHEEVNLDSYVDFNVKIGYRPTKNWTVFVKGNNLLNQEYNQWGSFRAQGIQVMGGAVYKFDL